MEDNSQEKHIIFEEGIEQKEYLTALGNNLYRLEATPLFTNTRLFLGDIIEATPLENGVLHFERVVETTLRRHWDLLLSKDVVDTDAFQRLKENVEMHGGIWESALGGAFFIHMPLDTSYNPEVEIANLSK